MVDGKARRDGGQPCLGGLDLRSAFGLAVVAKERFLDDVFGLARAAHHPVGDREQQGPKLLVHGVPFFGDTAGRVHLHLLRQIRAPVCDTSISDRPRMSQGRRPPCPRGRNHGIHETRGARMMPATQRLAGASARRPWLVVGLWIVAIAIAGYASSQFLAGALTTEIEVTNDPEAQRAADLIEQRFGAAGVTEVFILTSED